MLQPMEYDTEIVGVDASRRTMCSLADAGLPVAITGAIAAAAAVGAQAEHGVAELRTTAVGVAIAVTTAVGVVDAGAVDVGEPAF